MWFVVSIVLLSIFFCVLYLKEVFACVCFVIQKNKSNEKTLKKETKTRKKYVVKNKLILARKMLKNCLQTKGFGEKFLYEKEYENIDFSVKFLCDKILKKLKTNVCLFNKKIDFKMISGSGIDLSKPVFLIRGFNNFKIVDNAIAIAQKHFSFEPIFVCEKPFQTKYKQIVFDDINLKLFQEINKINLNYDDKFNKKKSNKKFNGKIEKIYNFENNNVSFFMLSNSNQKAKILIKINKLYYNIFQSKNWFRVEGNDGETFEYSTNSKIEKIDKLNLGGEQYLQVTLNLIKNVETHLVCDPSFISKKQLLLKEKIEFEKLFGVKIYTKNKEFNSFFNYSLKERMIEEFKEKNSTEKKKIDCNKRIFKNLFGFDENSFNFESYFELYELILKDVFGIRVLKNRFFVNPKIKIDFKVVMFHNNQLRNIYVSSSGKKELVVDGVVFSNISFVDLNLIEKTAFLCV